MSHFDCGNLLNFVVLRLSVIGCTAQHIASYAAEDANYSFGINGIYYSKSNRCSNNQYYSKHVQGIRSHKDQTEGPRCSLLRFPKRYCPDNRYTYDHRDRQDGAIEREQS